MKKIITVFKPDVIHAHGKICGLAAIKMGKKLGIPVVLTIQGIDTCPRVWKGPGVKMFAQVLNGVDRLIFVGKPLQIAYKDKVLKKDHQFPWKQSAHETLQIIREVSWATN